jgi:hypothetical protein
MMLVKDGKKHTGEYIHPALDKRKAVLRVELAKKGDSMSLLSLNFSAPPLQRSVRREESKVKQDLRFNVEGVNA